MFQSLCAEQTGLGRFPAPSTALIRALSTFLARAGGAATKHIRKGEQVAVGVGIVDGSGERSAEDVVGDLFAA